MSDRRLLVTVYCLLITDRMNFEEAFSIADSSVFEKTGKHLSDVEKIILEGAWNGQNYEKIADAAGYSPDYIRGDAAPKFWKLLSEAFGEQVKKTNFRAALERKAQLEPPQPLDIGFYVDRPPIETNCCATIVQPGALIRIKAPQKMGKTLLLEKILSYARQQGYKTVKLDFELADNSVLASLKTFLQWLCVDVSDSVGVEDKVEDYWRDLYGLNKNCTRYFQKYLLPTIECPLVLALDNFDRLFEYPTIFNDFCHLLRGWYETAKQGDRLGNLWKQLRLIVVHSTEVYPTLDTNHSPFNVGSAIELPEFTSEQVNAIAQHYQIDAKQLGENGLTSLMATVGGHPYLIQQALEYLRDRNLSLPHLLETAPTEAGLYSNYLRSHLWNLQHNPKLETAYRQVVNSSEPVMLDSEVAFKLRSMGLVKPIGNDCVPSCELYRQYFSVRLAGG